MGAAIASQACFRNLSRPRSRTIRSSPLQRQRALASIRLIASFRHRLRAIRDMKDLDRATTRNLHLPEDLSEIPMNKLHLNERRYRIHSPRITRAVSVLGRTTPLLSNTADSPRELHFDEAVRRGCMPGPLGIIPDDDCPAVEHGLLERAADLGSAIVEVEELDHGLCVVALK